MSELTDYKISQHCKQRYAERIMDRDSANDINRFITENEDKIKTDINKMITYGLLIFTGKQSQKDGKGKVLDVYVRDTWVVLVDEPAANVVTLFKIDLGLDDEFNKMYVNKMIAKIQESQQAANDIKEQLGQETTEYKNMISDIEGHINEYKSMIKKLEELSSSYKTIIDNNSVTLDKANRDVADIVNQLVEKRVF